MGHEPGPRELVLGTLAVLGMGLLGHTAWVASVGELCTVGGSCLTAASDPVAFWGTVAWLASLTGAAVVGAWLGSVKLGMPLLPARQRQPQTVPVHHAPRLRIVRASSSGR